MFAVEESTFTRQQETATHQILHAIQSDNLGRSARITYTCSVAKIEWFHPYRGIVPFEISYRAYNHNRDCVLNAELDRCDGQGSIISVVVLGKEFPRLDDLMPIIRVARFIEKEILE